MSLPCKRNSNHNASHQGRPLLSCLPPFMTPSHPDPPIRTSSHHDPSPHDPLLVRPHPSCPPTITTPRCSAASLNPKQRSDLCMLRTCGSHDAQRILPGPCYITLQLALRLFQFHLQQLHLGFKHCHISAAGMSHREARHSTHEVAVGPPTEAASGACKVWRRRHQVKVCCSGSWARLGLEGACVMKATGRLAPVGLALDLRQQLQAGSSAMSTPGAQWWYCGTVPSP